MAVVVAGTVPVERKGEESDLMKFAKAIGEGTLLDTDKGDKGSNAPNTTPDGIKYNSHERLMSLFGNTSFTDRAF